MKPFLRDLLLFGLIQLPIALLLGVGYEPDPGGYIAATIDKNERLRSAGAPRLAIVGGSGSAFGFDGARIAEATGWEPVNLGLHGGLGLDFMLAEAAAGLRPGDVALLMIEYELFAGETASDILIEALEQRPAHVGLLGAGQYPALIDSGLAYIGRVGREGVRRLRGKGHRGGKPPYSRDSFNRWGDVEAHRAMGPREWTTKAMLPAGLPRRDVERTLERLRRFQAEMEARGVTVLFTFAPVPEGEFAANREKIEGLRERIVRETGFPVVLEPGEAVLPADHFFDSVYHLNDRGIARHMDRLIPALARLLPSRPPPRTSAP